MKSITTVVISIVILGFVFLAQPDNGLAGTTMPPVLLGCCQVEPNQCGNIFSPGNLTCSSENFLPGESCNESTGQCRPDTRNIPAISQWGLLSLAAVLALVALGAFVARRNKASA
ncbi:MAG: hypothetical protein AAF462_09525 [Thermodesulfobacteriota bacterium]